MRKILFTAMAASMGLVGCTKSSSMEEIDLRQEGVGLVNPNLVKVVKFDPVLDDLTHGNKKYTVFYCNIKDSTIVEVYNAFHNVVKLPITHYKEASKQAQNAFTEAHEYAYSFPKLNVPKQP